MSNRLPPKPQIDTAALRSLKTIADVQKWLINYTTAMEKWYKKVKDTFDNFGAGTPNWDIRDATAADVADGNAKTVGDLIIIHKTLGVKRDFSPPT